MSTVMPAPSHPVIDEAERDRRQREVDFARGSVRYEGGILPCEIERLTLATSPARSAATS